VIAAGTLAASTQGLNNDAGLIQSVGDAVINTNGQALDNTNSGNTGGIVSGAALNVQSGSLNNQNGFIASSGNHTLTIAGAADNRGGSISSNGDTTLSAATFDNRGVSYQCQRQSRCRGGRFAGQPRWQPDCRWQRDAVCGDDRQQQ